ncbi:N-acetyltransferase ESCO2 [Gracilariopsis chorda]|uniref:N-acetyltransferase ESCO2 n=1 Tax=Gracilariopsis chorda TaxID=448386 RepID=A0A2V3IJS0_9FLOR|nr:N-acetyltransferase ESCO2 [Gracilariopsis chorda]|eukprot:PXF42322.1 N-acetyltransferase ESCO2 [Gracilariopsis chorda]
MPIVYSRKRLRARNLQTEPPPRTNSQPPSPRTPSAHRKPRKRRRLQQLYIDAGQAALSHTVCRRCNLLYAPGTSDDALHRARHSNTPHSFSWPLRNATLLPQTSVNGGEFVAVRISDCEDAAVARRLRRLDTFLCAQLGSHTGAALVKSALKLAFKRADHDVWIVVLYVEKGHVRGYAHAERVTFANRARVLDDGVSEIVNSGKHYVSDKILCGIRKIWVHQSCRKVGVATALVDLARTHLLYAGTIQRSSVAFTPPTTSGALFARKYSALSDSHILVYQLAEDGRPVRQVQQQPSPHRLGHVST